MKFVSVKSGASEESILSALKSSDKVNERVKFDEKQGRPVMKLKERGKALYMSCEMVGGPTKDNGFLIGSFFLGRLTRKGDECRLRGILLTAPIYHLALLAFCAYFAVQAFIVGGIPIVPIIVAAFSLLVFKDEFKKQGIIKRFILRAVRYAEHSSDASNNELG